MTDFYNHDVEREYNWLLSKIGAGDSYHSPVTLGLTDVLRAHFLIVDFFVSENHELGGIGPKDLNLLHSALHRPLIQFDGVERWPNALDKAATTLFGLIKNHPFHDANKRTALLSILYLLSKQGLMPTCAKKQFEDFTVEIAEMGLAKRARYQKLLKTTEDPEIKYISWWLRSNIRQVDRRDYVITMRELRRILARFGYILTNPKDNMIDICKVERRRKLFVFGPLEEVRTRVTRMGYHSETAQIALSDIKRLRKDLKLRHTEGVDSQTFYHGLDDMTSLLAEYKITSVVSLIVEQFLRSQIVDARMMSNHASDNPSSRH